jgi:hypothetical protein
MGRLSGDAPETTTGRTSAMSTYGDNEPTSRPVRNDPAPSGTTAGADATARMGGTHSGPPHTDEVRTADGTDRQVEEVRQTDRSHAILPAKTSAAATFTLVFGLAALFCALTALLAPAAVLFGLIGIGLGVVAMKMVKRPGVTGRGVAIGGLVTAVLGLLLGLAVIAGAAVLVNDEQRLDQIQDQLDDLRADLPSVEQIQEEIPG